MIRFWGDPIACHLPTDTTTVAVTHTHEGVWLKINGALVACTGPEGARDLADSLQKAARQWEE
jgi:uncharacterized Zn-binding protein involved in type VI secretion